MLVAPAGAGELTYGRSPSQLGPADLQIWRNIQRREAFQLNERLLRELDRRAVDAPQRQPEIPVMKRSCQTQVYGSRILRTCR